MRITIGAVCVLDTVLDTCVHWNSADVFACFCPACRVQFACLLSEGTRSMRSVWCCQHDDGQLIDGLVRLTMRGCSWYNATCVFRFGVICYALVYSCSGVKRYTMTQEAEEKGVCISVHRVVVSVSAALDILHMRVVGSDASVKDAHFDTSPAKSPFPQLFSFQCPCSPRHSQFSIVDILDNRYTLLTGTISCPRNASAHFALCIWYTLINGTMFRLLRPYWILSSDCNYGHDNNSLTFRSVPVSELRLHWSPPLSIKP